jgi:hypothetical protein
MAENIKPPVATKAVKLRAIEPIRHDGDDVAPGETFSASPEAAAALVASGAAEAVK